MKYILSIIFCFILSACNGGGGSGLDSGLPTNNNTNTNIGSGPGNASSWVPGDYIQYNLFSNQADPVSNLNNLDVDSICSQLTFCLSADSSHPRDLSFYIKDPISATSLNKAFALVQVGKVNTPLSDATFSNNTAPTAMLLFLSFGIVKTTAIGFNESSNLRYKTGTEIQRSFSCDAGRLCSNTSGDFFYTDGKMIVFVRDSIMYVGLGSSTSAPSRYDLAGLSYNTHSAQTAGSRNLLGSSSTSLDAITYINTSGLVRNVNTVYVANIEGANNTLFILSGLETDYPNAHHALIKGSGNYSVAVVGDYNGKKVVMASSSFLQPTTVLENSVAVSKSFGAGQLNFFFER